MAQGFAQKFAALRRKKGISQRQAAAELNISQALLSHYENGLREPRLDFVVKACEYYGVTADYILGRTEEYSDDASSLMETIPQLINQMGERYGTQAAENAVYYANLAMYKFAACTDMAEAEKCRAAMAILEAEMLEQRGNDILTARWLEKERPEQCEKIKEKIKSVKAR